MTNQKKSIWSLIGWILAVIAALLLIISPVLQIVGTVIDILVTLSGVGGAGNLVTQIIAIIIGVIILLIELDKLKQVKMEHLVKGIVYLIIGIYFSYLLALAGIFYILAGVLK